MDTLKIAATTNSVEVAIGHYGSSLRVLTIEFVLDFNKYGSIIGIEILNLSLEAGAHFINRIIECMDLASRGAQYSYDAECDAFYLQLSEEDSADQKAVEGRVTLNEKGEIVGLCANWN